VAIFSCKKFSPKTLSLSTIHLLGMDRWTTTMPVTRPLLNYGWLTKLFTRNAIWNLGSGSQLTWANDRHSALCRNRWTVGDVDVSPSCLAK